MCSQESIQSLPLFRGYWDGIHPTNVAQSNPFFKCQRNLAHLNAIEEQLAIQNELLLAHIERDYVFDQVNCEYAETKNPETEKHLDGMRIYDNLDTAIACLYYRNPPGHIYLTPPGHVNPPGHENYTNIDPHVHPHEDIEEIDAPVD